MFTGLLLVTGYEPDSIVGNEIERCPCNLTMLMEASSLAYSFIIHQECQSLSHQFL